MKFIADLHIHSRFSRATARNLDFVTLHRSALKKGIGLLGTGDFTHPGWMAEIEEQLVLAEDGFFMLKPELKRASEAEVPKSCAGEVRFVLQTEISNIYKKNGLTRKNHNLVFLPTLDAARSFSKKLSKVGNLTSDGRPILGLDARDLLETVLETHPSAFLIPAHIWTPWFSMFGSKSGFNSIAECFGDLSSEIFAVETGLSSDPPMNWRVQELDCRTLVSNSDAHSAANLGREANLLDIDFGYLPLFDALRTGKGFLGTLEFFPEQGKYHLDGHRKCNTKLSPEETKRLGGKCPICGKLITVGVMSRIEDMSSSDRPTGYKAKERPAFESLVSLSEIAAEVLDVGSLSKKVSALTEKLIESLGSELHILRQSPLEDIEAKAGFFMREAVRRVRKKEVTPEAGYDGQFGTVRIFSDKERTDLMMKKNNLFSS